MGAKEKLNQIHIAGALGLAGFIGLATGSWAVFAATGAALLAASWYTGDIRVGKGQRR